MPSVDIAALQRQAVTIVLAMAPEPVEQPTGSTRLVEDLGYDSLRLLELGIAIEEHFGLSANPEDASEVATLTDVEALVARFVDIRRSA